MLNTQLPDKQTYRAKNHSVSITAPSSPTKVTWDSSGKIQHDPKNQQVGQEKTTFQNRNMNKNIKHINMCKQRQTEPNQTSSKTEKVDNLDNKDDKKISKPEIHDYFKTTVAACALNKDKSTTQELIQYHEKRIACTSDQNKSEKLNKQVIKKHKNKPLLFQKMLIKNEGQSDPQQAGEEQGAQS